MTSGKSSRQPAKTQALNYMRSLERPAGITQREWVGLKAFLYIVARGQPRMVKSQETIAAEMGVTARSVRRYVRQAKAVGLLTVWYDSGTKSRRSPTRTSRYFVPPLVTKKLIEPEELSSLRGEELSCNRHSDSKLSLRQEQSSSQRDFVSLRESAAAAPPRRVAEVISERAARAIANGSADVTPRIKRRPPAEDRDPARRTANYFADQWYHMTESLSSGRLDGVRQWEGKQATVGVLRNVFFAPASGKRFTEEEVRAKIDAFIANVRSSRILVKPGQSAFMRFMGTYDRGKAPPRPVDKPFKFV